MSPTWQLLQLILEMERGGPDWGQGSLEMGLGGARGLERPCRGTMENNPGYRKWDQT